MGKMKNSQTIRGQSLLHVACENNNVDLVKHLLGLGVLVNTEDMKGWMPLHSAAYNGHGEVVEELLKVSGEQGAVYSAKDGPIDLDAKVDHPKPGDKAGPDDLAKHKGHSEIATRIRGESLLSFDI